jgi:hypothetical protein
MYVQDGHALDTHDDVPEHVREELYAEEQKSLERNQKISGTSAAIPSTVHITNVMPQPSGAMSHLASVTGSPVPEMSSQQHTADNHLNIPGFRDDAVKEYCAWQRSQVKEPALKAAYNTACSVILEEGMDLELIREDPDPDFLVKRGVKRGIARQVVRDIDYWARNIKQSQTEE